MKRAQGTCKYCKQIRIVMVGDDENLTQEQIDDRATRGCNCDTAREMQRREDTYNDAMATIKAMQIIDSDTKDILDRVARKVANGDYDSATITTTYNVRLRVAMQKGKIIVRAKESNDIEAVAGEVTEIGPGRWRKE